MGESHTPLVGLSRCFQILEDHQFQEEGLQNWQDQLNQNSPPSQRISLIASSVQSLAVRHSALLYGIVSIGLLWEIWHGVQVWKWRNQFGTQVQSDLELLYDFEVLSSLADFSFNHPLHCWPTVKSYESHLPLLEAKQIGHPLFKKQGLKCNDFTLAKPVHLHLITGSNMSGKSSFLRTLGTNSVLAFIGAPVCAQNLEICQFRLSASIQIMDDPTQGWSRFYAEVRRIAQVLEDAQRSTLNRPTLYLIDEMLSGTNSRERRLASRTIARTLLDAPHSFGLITTHDLDLAQLQTLYPQKMQCGHFSDHFDGTRLSFDYQLRSGVAKTTNALLVLKLEGIEVDEVHEENVQQNTDQNRAQSTNKIINQDLENQTEKR